MSERIEFKVGKKYKNVKGFYRVISIDSKNDAMLIQWKTGEKLKTSIKLQERIIKRLSFEKSIAEKEQGLPHSVYKKNGIQKVYYIDGQIKMKIPWVNDKKHGVLKTYYQFGKIVSSYNMLGEMEFDEKDGELKSETIYVNNKKHGIEKLYYDSGEIKMEIPWVNDKKHGIKITYYKIGDIQTETPYIDDKKHGVLKTYYQFGFIYLSLEEMKFRDFDKRGQLKNETIYVNNKKHGIEKTYHDGWVVIQTETPWVNNKKHGIEKVYYRNGKVKSEITYVDDKIVQKNNHFFSRFF